MTWKLRTISECVNAMSAALESWLPGADARLARNNLGPTATAIGGEHWALEAKMARLVRGRFVHLCDEDELLDHGADLGMPRKAAAAATGPMVVTAAGAAAIEAGALVRRADGVRYRVTSAGSISGAGVFTVSLVALVAGTAGNTAAGTTLTILSGLTGEAVLTVGGDGLSGGAEVEEIETYRVRLLERLAFPPQGGVTSDYWRWATGVEGCTTCYVWPRRGGAGRNTLYPIFDGRRTDGLPTTDDLALVREAIEASAPDGAINAVAAFVPHPIDIRISGLLPATDAVKDAIRAEIANIFAERSRVSGQAEAHPSFSMRATPFTWSREWIGEAISRATGETRHVLDLPLADTVLADGERATVGAIDFV